MKNTGLRILYAVSDYIMSLGGVLLFNIIRYFNRPPGTDSRTIEVWLFRDTHILYGLALFPLMMLAFYAISGYYNDVRAKSRLDDVRNSLTVGLIGMLFVYFITMIDDYLPNRIHNYELLAILWGCLSIPVMIGRLTITHFQRNRLMAQDGIYRAVVIGTPDKVANLRRRICLKSGISSYKIESEISPDTPTEEIIRKIKEIAPEAILITPLPAGIQASTDLITRLYPLEHTILITPDLYQLITSRTRLTDIVSEPLIDITNAQVSPSTTNMKRLADIAGSLLSLIILAPVYAAIALAVKLDSPGPVFYTQERIGYHKKPFKIIKFRTMNADAEPDGPTLSVPDDPRITSVGRFLRKYRLDELPQFWNVLRGDMSLVGPRPERKHFVDKIVERVPHYSLIHQVRPGITSWGMVKYGYASSVDEMVERLYYDLLYIDNVSFAVDLKIIFHTLSTVISGRGM